MQFFVHSAHSLLRSTVSIFVDLSCILIIWFSVPQIGHIHRFIVKYHWALLMYLKLLLSAVRIEFQLFKKPRHLLTNYTDNKSFKVTCMRFLRLTIMHKWLNSNAFLLHLFSVCLKFVYLLICLSSSEFTSACRLFIVEPAPYGIRRHAWADRWILSNVPIVRKQIESFIFDESFISHKYVLKEWRDGVELLKCRIFYNKKSVNSK